jgi:hypothetical protein
MYSEFKKTKKKSSSVKMNKDPININFERTNFMKFFYKKTYTFKREKEKELNIEIEKEKNNKIKKDGSIIKYKKINIELRPYDIKRNNNNIALIKDYKNSSINKINSLNNSTKTIYKCKSNSKNDIKNSNIFHNNNNNKYINPKFLNNLSKKNSIRNNFFDKKLTKIRSNSNFNYNSNSINSIENINKTNINTPIKKNKNFFVLNKYSFIENKNKNEIENNNINSKNNNNKDILNSSNNLNDNISFQKSTNITPQSHKLNIANPLNNDILSNNSINNNNNYDNNNENNKNEIFNFSLNEKSLILHKKNSIDDFNFIRSIIIENENISEDDKDKDKDNKNNNEINKYFFINKKLDENPILFFKVINNSYINNNISKEKKNRNEFLKGILYLFLFI